MLSPSGVQVSMRKLKCVLRCHLQRLLPQSSSASRFTARRCRVLHLEPVAGAPGGIARAQTLADDALEPELAGVAENDVARLGDVLVGLQSSPVLGDESLKRRLASLDRPAAQIP